MCVCVCVDEIVGVGAGVGVCVCEVSHFLATLQRLFLNPRIKHSRLNNFLVHSGIFF